MRRVMGGQISEADVAGVADAIALFSFLLVSKLSLLLWQIFVKHSHPLADVPADGMVFLVGYDLLVCLIVGLACGALEQMKSRGGRAVRLLASVLRGLILGGIVSFCVVSFQVARIYSEPLTVDLLRSAGSLWFLRRSIWEYVGLMPVALLAYGLIAVPLIAAALRRWLKRRQFHFVRWHFWLTTSTFCCVFGVFEWIRLRGIDTLGVKENALVFFIKEYRAQFQPADAPQLADDLYARFGTSLDRDKPPSSILAPGRMLQRDFDYSGGIAKDFNVIVIQMESTGALHCDRQSALNITALGRFGTQLQTPRNRRHANAHGLVRFVLFGLPS